MVDRQLLPWRDRRARQGGPHGKLVSDGSSFVKINWDSVQERSSGHLAVDDVLANDDFKATRDLLIDHADQFSERDLRQLRKLERQALDTLLADRRSWCPSCLNVLHNCHCADDLAAKFRVSNEAVDFIHNLRRADVEEREAKKRDEKIARRLAYRQAKKNRKAGS